MIDWSTGQFESHGEIADVQWEMVVRRDDGPDVDGERSSGFLFERFETVHVHDDIEQLSPPTDQ